MHTARMVVLFSLLKGPSVHISIMAVLVDTPTNGEQGVLFPYPLPNIYCSLSYDERLNGDEELKGVLFSISLKAKGVFKRRLRNLLLASYIFHSFLLS